MRTKGTNSVRTQLHSLKLEREEEPQSIPPGGEGE